MKSYLKFLSRNKLYTAIEAVGLVVSLAFVLLTGHFVWQQRQMTRNVPDYKDVYTFYRSMRGSSGIGFSLHAASTHNESITGNCPWLNSSFNLAAILFGCAESSSFFILK